MNTLSIHSYTHRGIKIGALKMQLVFIFFHICCVVNLYFQRYILNGNKINADTCVSLT